jgi:hypothetical protein
MSNRTVVAVYSYRGPNLGSRQCHTRGVNFWTNNVKKFGGESRALAASPTFSEGPILAIGTRPRRP